MAKRVFLDDQIAAISQTKREPLSPKSIEVLRTALSSTHSVIVERAAVAAKQLNADELLPDLARAFDRCLRGDVDDGVLLTTAALADALQELHSHDADLFLRGLKLRKPQLPSGDAATGVRCACAFGLARCHYRHDLWELAALLHDKIPACRSAAAKALAMTGLEAAAPLLKFKILIGDRQPDVIADCLSALMSLAPQIALPFVAHQLDAEDPMIAEAAALALGESRRPEALAELTRRVATADPAMRRVLLLAVGLLRSAEGTAYLLDRVSHAEPRTAADAIAGLAFYKQDSTLKEKLAQAVKINGVKSVREAFAKEFS